MSQDIYTDKTLQPCVSIHRDIHYKLLSKEQLIISKPQKTIQAQQLQKQVENQNNYDFEFQSIDIAKYKESKFAIHQLKQQAEEPAPTAKNRNANANNEDDKSMHSETNKKDARDKKNEFAKPTNNAKNQEQKIGKKGRPKMVK